MTERVTTNGLQVDRKLFDFVETRALPGTGVAPDAFWSGFAALIRDLSSKNRALLDKRADLQSQIDA